MTNIVLQRVRIKFILTKGVLAVVGEVRVVSSPDSNNNGTSYKCEVVSSGDDDDSGTSYTCSDDAI